MRVKVLVEFDVEQIGAAFELSEKDAREAAASAIFNNLCLTKVGLDVVEHVDVGVQGYGKCRVKVVDGYE